MQNFINQKIDTLKKKTNFNCCQNSLVVLGELFNIEIEPQVIAAGKGMNGAGHFRAQCGLVEGPIMFIGILAEMNDLTKREVQEVCYRFADGFVKRFSSIRCEDLRPGGFKSSDSPSVCDELTKKSILYAARHIKKEFDL